MERTIWSSLDRSPEKHINEPVIASCLVGPRGGAKRSLMAGVVGSVVEGIIPGENAAAELVKQGLGKGAEAAAEKLMERGHKEEIELTEQMYLVVGASKLGLYEVGRGKLHMFALRKQLLLVPLTAVAECTIGETHLLRTDLTIRLTYGPELELDFGRGLRKFIEQIQATIERAKPFPPSGPLPPAGYVMPSPAFPSWSVPPPGYVMSPAPAYAPQKTKEQWIQEGRAYAGARRFQEALAAYEAALQLDPHLGYAHFGRGEALRVLNRPEEALLAFEWAIQLAPYDAAPYRHRGYVLNTLRRYGEALAALEYAARLEPAHAGAYVGQGDALKGLQRPQEALAAYDRAIAIDPRLADAYIGRGDALSALGQYPQAAQAYEQALQIEPGNALAAAGRQTAQRLLGQPAIRTSDSFAAPPSAPAFQPVPPHAAFPGGAAPSGELKGVFTLPSGRRVALPDTEAIVGRGPFAGPDAVEVNLASEQEQQTVSRRHAIIRRTHTGFELEDLHSANQTLLNNGPLQPGRPVHLHHGDVVEFGSVRCVFTFEQV